MEMHQAKMAFLAVVLHYVGQWRPLCPTQMAPSPGLATRAAQLWFGKYMPISKFGKYISKFGRYFTAPCRATPCRAVLHRTVPHRTGPSDSLFPIMVMHDSQFPNIVMQ